MSDSKTGGKPSSGSESKPAGGDAKNDEKLKNQNESEVKNDEETEDSPVDEEGEESSEESSEVEDSGPEGGSEEAGESEGADAGSDSGSGSLGGSNPLTGGGAVPGTPKVPGMPGPRMPEGPKHLKEKAEGAKQKVEELKEDLEEAKQRLDRAKKLSKPVLEGLQAVVANPITWIAALIVIILMAVYAAFISLGPNDNRCAEDTGPAGKLAISKDKDYKENAAEVIRFLTSYKFESLGGKGFTKEQAIGIAGNMMSESAFQTGAENPSSAAYGLVQWLGGRRENLEAFAKSKGKEPTDPNLQVEFIDHELSTSEKATAEAFRDTTRYSTPEEWCREWYKLFERGGEGEYGKREEYATEFSSLSIPGGSSTSCESNLDMSDMVNLAISVAHPLGTPKSETEVPSAGSCAGAKDKARKEYVELREKQLAEAPDGHKGGLDDGWFADCGKFVGSVVIMAADPDFPQAGTYTQEPYVQSSSKWKEIGTISSFDELQPGDIFFKDNPGHTGMYVGEVDGETHVIAQASLCDYTPRLSPAYSEQLNFRWYRYVG